MRLATYDSTVKAFEAVKLGFLYLTMSIFVLGIVQIVSAVHNTAAQRSLSARIDELEKEVKELHQVAKE